MSSFNTNGSGKVINNEIKITGGQGISIGDNVHAEVVHNSIYIDGDTHSITGSDTVRSSAVTFVAGNNEIKAWLASVNRIDNSNKRYDFTRYLDI